MRDLEQLTRFILAGRPRHAPEEVYSLLGEGCMSPALKGFVDALVRFGFAADLGDIEFHDHWMLDNKPPGLSFAEGRAAQRCLWFGRSAGGDLYVGVQWGEEGACELCSCEILEAKRVVPTSLSAILDRVEFQAEDSAGEEGEPATLPVDLRALRDA